MKMDKRQLDFFAVECTKSGLGWHWISYCACFELSYLAMLFVSRHLVHIAYEYDGVLSAVSLRFNRCFADTLCVQAVTTRRRRTLVGRRYSRQTWRKSRCTTTCMTKAWSRTGWVLLHLLTWWV